MYDAEELAVTPSPTRRRPWALLAVALATFMTYLDNNIVNVALPAIQRDLHLTTAGLEWVVSGYVLVFAGLLLAGGRLADAYGRRRLFLAGLAVFTAASLAAGLAGSAEVLVAARAVQGLGAALVTPTTLAIISNAFPDPRERASAVGVWAGVGALALAVGPLLGGVLAQHASWGWIFTLNVPVGAGTLLLGGWAVTGSREAARRRLDLPGVGLSVVALTALTWSLIEGGSRGWTSAAVLGSFAVAALAGVLFVLVEQRSADPMVEVSLFRARSFSGGILARCCGRSGCSASTSSPRSTCRTCSPSRRPRPGWPSCRWRCAWWPARCSPSGWPAGWARRGWWARRCCSWRWASAR
jgi:EmrB/QacA subfamily drug resistance transporter